jgi:pimeloyl-ACP methyl ester carboxylesterase
VSAVAEDANQRWQVLAASSHCEPLDVVFDGFSGLARLVSFERPKPFWKCLDEEMEQDLLQIRRFAGGELGFGNATDDGSTLLVNVDFVDRPDELWAYRRGAGERGGLSCQLRFDQPRMADPLPARRSWSDVPARDGATLVLASCCPASVDDSGSRSLSHVFIVDDAPWTRSQFPIAAERTWLATRGYAADSVIARGAPSGSARFRDWIGASADDLIDAARGLIDRKAARPGSIAIMGHGFGGLAGLRAIEREPELFACGVAIDAPLSVAAMRRQFRAPEAQRDRLFSLRIGPSGDKAWRDSVAPLTQIVHVSRPFLVVQSRTHDEGALADIAQIEQSIQSAARSVFTYVANGPGTSVADTRLAAFARIESFVVEHLTPWEGRAASVSVTSPEHDDSH